MQSVRLAVVMTAAACLAGCAQRVVESPVTDHAALPADMTNEAASHARLTFDGGGGWTVRGLMTPIDRETPWRSPTLAVEPLEYVRLEAEARGKVFVGVRSDNPAASFGRRPGEKGARGTLVADDWTRFGGSGDAWMKHVYFSRARCNAESVAVELARGEVRRLSVRRARRGEVLLWLDRLYASMPKISYEAPADRFRRLPRTHDRLRRGEEVTIVLVGDSIMNDTGNGGLDVLLERAWGYGRPRVKVVTAVGNGTGMQHWSREEEYDWPDLDLDVGQAVVARRPDLVILGGISNRDAEEHFPEMIETIRAGVEGAYGYWPDMMLMSGPFGTPRRKDNRWGRRWHERRAEYARTLREIAESYETAFFDIRAETEHYFETTEAAGRARMTFYRDGIHANHLGKQLLARLLLERLGP